MTGAPALDAAAVAAIIDATNRALGEDLTRHTPEALSRHPPEVLAHLAGWVDAVAAKVALAQRPQQGGHMRTASLTRAAAVVIWTIAVVVDLAGELQPPPDPPRGERELWEI